MLVGRLALDPREAGQPQAPEAHGENNQEAEQQRGGQPAGRDEGVDRELVQSAAAGQEGAVEERQEGGDGDQEVDLLPASPRLLHLQPVDECPAEKPGHEGRDLDRVPGPVAAPAQRLVRPIATQEEAKAQEHEGIDGPGHRLPHPAVPVPTDQRAQRQGAWDQRCSEAHEHDGRVDRHPEVLEQDIEALAVPGDNGERAQAEQLLEGRPRGQVHILRPLGHHLERRHQREHREQEELDGADERHHVRLRLAEAAQQDGREDEAVDQPQQERPLLLGPERGDAEPERQRLIGHLPDVLDLVVPAEDHHPEHRRGQESAAHGDVEGAAAEGG